MVANTGQLTQQYVSKSMVVIPGYLEWPQIYHGQIMSPIHNWNAKYLRCDKTK